jgi:hypothetical protein
VFQQPTLLRTFLKRKVGCRCQLLGAAGVKCEALRCGGTAERHARRKTDDDAYLQYVIATSDKPAGVDIQHPATSINEPVVMMALEDIVSLAIVRCDEVRAYELSDKAPAGYLWRSRVV